MNQSVKKQQNLTFGDDKNSLILIVGAVLMLFFLSKFLWVGYFLSGKSDARFFSEIMSYLFLSSDNQTVVYRPWTIFTHSWLHYENLLFVGNMFWLVSFGYITQDLGKRTTLIPNYIVGSFVGSIFFIITNTFAAPEATYYLSGSSLAIIAIAATVCLYQPNYRIFPRINGGLPVWLLGAALLIIKTVQVIALPVSVQVAYLAAAIWGIFYGLQLKNGRDVLHFINQFFSYCNNLFNPEKNKVETKPTTFNYIVEDKPPFQKYNQITQKRIDEILDKINQQGYRYLTEEEKKLLKRAADDDEI